MLDEVTINKLSQLVYLDLPAAVSAGGPPTVGAVADYYTYDSVGKAHLRTRFGGIPEEYAGWRAFLSDDIADVRDFRIRNIGDDNGKGGSGFYACCYLSGEGELVAAFRGSEMLGNRRYKSDYESDFALAFEERTPQHKAVEDYLRRHDEFRARPFTLTGHSLGGNLALHGAARAPAPELLQTCYAFNAPGFNSGYLETNSARIEGVRGRLRLMQNKHDLVSSLLYPPADPVVLSSRFDPHALDEPSVPEILYPHSNFLFVREGGRFARDPEGKKDSLCRAVAALTDLFLRLPVFIRKMVSRLVLEILYTAQPAEKRVDFLLESITRYLVRNGTEADGPGFALSKGLFTARQLGAGYSESALYRRIAEDGDQEHGLALSALLLLRLMQYACADGC